MKCPGKDVSHQIGAGPNAGAFVVRPRIIQACESPKLSLLRRDGVQEER